MIPILYAPGTTDFSTNGLGRLTDCISCDVTEERNGQYELEMQYPLTGAHFADIYDESIISAVPSDGTTRQPFEVYKISKPIKGVVTVFAHHISYRAKKITVMPFNSSAIGIAMAEIGGHCVPGCPFTFWTNKATTGNFEVKEPKVLREIIGGSSGSFLDVYGGGEWEFDGFSCKLYQKRGNDNGVTLRYGKNIVSMKHSTDIESVYTAVVPFWKGSSGDEGEQEEVVVGMIASSGHESEYAAQLVVPLDLSGSFQTKPTVEQLNLKAHSFMSINEPWQADRSVEVDFVALWQTEEYKDIAHLERVKLCDTVTVIYKEIGVNDSLKVVKTVYDVLMDRYKKITLGKVTGNIESEITKPIVEELAKSFVKNTDLSSRISAAVSKSSELIKGGLGGYMVIVTNADGQPVEELFMDAPSIEQAVNIIRLNKNGIGVSNSGYNGEYTSAMTIDGAINGSLITAGEIDGALIRANSMLADAIKAGTIDADKVTITNLKVGKNVAMDADAKVSWENVEGIEGAVTTLTQNAVSTANISADQITAGTLDASKINVNGLVVGENVQMGANATISWDQVTGKDDINLDASIDWDDDVNKQAVTEISQHAISTAKISATQIDAGTLDASKVNVTNLSADAITGGTIDADVVRIVNLVVDDYVQLEPNATVQWSQVQGADDRVTSITREEISSANISANQINTGTLDASKVTVSNIDASQIKSGTIDADVVTISNLEVGDNVTMGANASINWSQVNGGSTAVTNIAKNEISSATISGNQINAGTIDASKVTVTNLNASNLKSGTIDADKITITNLEVGDNVAMGSNATINWSQVSGGSTAVTNIAKNEISTAKINATNITSGTLDASKVTVSNLSADSIKGGEIKTGDLLVSSAGGAVRASKLQSFGSTDYTGFEANGNIVTLQGYNSTSRKYAQGGIRITGSGSNILDLAAFNANTTAVTIGDSSNQYYYCNLGYNPGRYTERHYFSGDVRIPGTLKPDKITEVTSLEATGATITNLNVTNLTATNVTSANSSGTDKTVASSTSWQSNSGVSFAAPANGTYWVECSVRFVVSSSSATASTAGHFGFRLANDSGSSYGNAYTDIRYSTGKIDVYCRVSGTVTNTSKLNVQFFNNSGVSVTAQTRWQYIRIK